MPAEYPVEVKVRLYGRFRRGRLLTVNFDTRTVDVKLLTWELPQGREVDPIHYGLHFHQLRAEDLKVLVKLQRGDADTVREIRGIGKWGINNLAQR